MKYTHFQTAFSFRQSQLCTSLQRRKLFRAIILKIRHPMNSELNVIDYFLPTRNINVVYNSDKIKIESILLQRLLLTYICSQTCAFLTGKIIAFATLPSKHVLEARTILCTFTTTQWGKCYWKPILQMRKPWDTSRSHSSNAGGVTRSPKLLILHYRIKSITQEHTLGTQSF